jgi:hypothetical protein
MDAMETKRETMESFMFYGVEATIEVFARRVLEVVGRKGSRCLDEEGEELMGNPKELTILQAHRSSSFLPGWPILWSKDGCAG